MEPQNLSYFFICATSHTLWALLKNCHPRRHKKEVRVGYGIWKVDCMWLNVLKTFYNDILIKAKNLMKHFYEFFVCSRRRIQKDSVWCIFFFCFISWNFHALFPKLKSFLHLFAFLVMMKNFFNFYNLFVFYYLRYDAERFWQYNLNYFYQLNWR